MRLKLGVQSFLSSTSAGEKDLGNLAPPSEVSDALQEGGSRTYKLPGAMTNQALDLAGLSEARYLLIRSDKEISIRLNATGNPIVISAPSGFSWGWFLLCTKNITSLDASNAGTDVATVLVQLAGDP